MARGSYRGKYLDFDPDHKSFGEFILSDQIRDPVAKVANDIAVRAGQLSPQGGNDTWEADNDVPLSRNFKVNKHAGTFDINGNVRVLVQVFNDLRHAAVIEFGGKDKRSRRHRMLGRAGAEYGDFKPEGGPDL